MTDGYDPGFLRDEVPLPHPVGSPPLRELTYPRFTVLLDTRRRLARVTAVNIDGAALQDLERTGQWRLDPRAPQSQQAGPDVYADNDLDRGHLVRRRDPGWGDVDEARSASEATFFYPNAAPQASAFNQSKDLWLGLEDHVLAFTDAADVRVSVFTAPVLADDDPPYRGIGIPRLFWKVAAWSNGSRLAAAGFVLDQSELIDAAREAVSVVPLGRFRTFQTSISEVARLSGVGLGPLAAADVLGGASARPDLAWIPLAEPSDIRLG